MFSIFILIAILVATCAINIWNRSQLNTLDKNDEGTKNTNPTGMASVVAAVAGFPKEGKEAKIRPGQMGQDAWLLFSSPSSDILAVADGIGGYSFMGIDPSDFSHSLLRSIEQVAKQDDLHPTQPVKLLSAAFSLLAGSEQHPAGGSTVSIVIVDRKLGKMLTANLGDSGFLVVRKGIVVHQSVDKNRSFNQPCHLSLAPAGQRNNNPDSPESADESQLSLEHGDVIMLATDGVFDNVLQAQLIQELSLLQGEGVVVDGTRVQLAADRIALLAKNQGSDAKFMSPFFVRAHQSGYYVGKVGGKTDDITVIVAVVRISGIGE